MTVPVVFGYTQDNLMSVAIMQGINGHSLKRILE